MKSMSSTLVDNTASASTHDDCEALLTRISALAKEDENEVLVYAYATQTRWLAEQNFISVPDDYPFWRGCRSSERLEKLRGMLDDTLSAIRKSTEKGMHDDRRRQLLRDLIQVANIQRKK